MFLWMVFVDQMTRFVWMLHIPAAVVTYKALPRQGYFYPTCDFGRLVYMCVQVHVDIYFTHVLMRR